MRLWRTLYLSLLFYFFFFNIFAEPDLNILMNNTTVLAHNGITIYVVPSITNHKILPFSLISSRYISDKISITACPGEFEPASFVIRPSHYVQSMEAEATNLTGTNGSISANNIDIHVVKCWYQAGTTVVNAQHKILTPELLLKDDNLVETINGDNYIKLGNNYIGVSYPAGIPGIPGTPTIDRFPVKDADTLQPLDIPSGTNKQLWVTIRVPDDAEPGIFTGRIILKTPIDPIAEITLTLKVLPITLLKPYLIYSLYYAGSLGNVGTISSGLKNEEQFRAEMKDLFDHGVTNPTVYQGLPLDKVLQIRKETGMNYQTLYYAGTRIDSYKDNLNYLKSNASDLLRSVKPYVIDEVYIYAPDEQLLDNSANRAQIEAVHEIGGKVFDAQNQDNATRVADVLDLAIVSGPPNISIANKFHIHGYKVLSYGNPQVGVEQPQTYRRNYGLLLWQKDYDGAMDFAYQWSNDSNIWDDFDDPAERDLVFAYPTANGVIDTIEWEGWREGVDDVRYLTTLLETIHEAKAEGKNTTDVENWLAGLKSSDLTKRDLNSVRSTIIDYILSLNSPDRYKFESYNNIG